MSASSREAQRIVSLLPAATEMLFALSLDERVVAVSHECDWPPPVRRLPRVTHTRVDPAATSEAIDARVRELMAAGEPLYEIDIERLAALRPDLVVTQVQCDVCAVPLAAVQGCLAAHPLLANAKLLTLNPLGIQDLLRDMERLADAAGCAMRAHQPVADLSSRIDAVRSRAAALPGPDRPRVAVVEWTAPLMLSGNWIPELVEMAGGASVGPRPGEPSRQVAWECLKAENPDVLLIVPCGFDLNRSCQEATALAALPSWDQLAAVQSGRVWAVDGNAWFNRPGPRLVESLEILAHLLHPASFAAPRTEQPAYQEAGEGPRCPLVNGAPPAPASGLD